MLKRVFLSIIFFLSIMGATYSQVPFTVTPLVETKTWIVEKFRVGDKMDFCSAKLTDGQKAFHFSFKEPTGIVGVLQITIGIELADTRYNFINDFVFTFDDGYEKVSPGFVFVNEFDQPSLQVYIGNDKEFEKALINSDTLFVSYATTSGKVTTEEFSLKEVTKDNFKILAECK